MNSPISLSSKKVMFLGYGAVAKCTWNYFSSYFTIPSSQVYLVDKNPKTFYGPKLDNVNLVVEDANPTNFESLLDSTSFAEGDIIIDLTFASSTYFFISVCLRRGIHYMNTSIEDESDLFHAGSIDHQQQIVEKLVEDHVKDHGKMKSCILTECGQNPGLIQHYVLYSLNQLYQMSHPTDPNGYKEYRKDVLTSMIDTYKIGTIFMSERDQLRTSRPLRKNTIYNTWSVAGFVAEGLDCAELVRGNHNPYIQPKIKDKHLHQGLMRLYKKYQNNGKQVLFLKENGRNSTLPSIAPVLTTSGKIQYKPYRGSLIHHGESFELANYFGEKAPFMTYVYQYSPYLEESLNQVEEDLSFRDRGEYLSFILSDPSSFCVFDNISISERQRMKGHDSIGCTILCGKKDVERIFWCGTILSDTDHINPLFTPTTVQVAAGILSGLSYIIEKGKSKYYQPCDLDTRYILDKAKPLLGKFFFTEIPKKSFNESLRLTFK